MLNAISIPFNLRNKEQIWQLFDKNDLLKLEVNFNK